MCTESIQNYSFHNCHLHGLFPLSFSPFPGVCRISVNKVLQREKSVFKNVMQFFSIQEKVFFMKKMKWIWKKALHRGSSNATADGMKQGKKLIYFLSVHCCYSVWTMDAFSFGCRYSIFLITTKSQARDFFTPFLGWHLLAQVINWINAIGRRKKIATQKTIKIKGQKRGLK